MAEWKTDGSDGGSAFPMSSTQGEHGPEFGMSLRDFFAAHALSGIMAVNQDYVETIAAGNAYALADAMLSERTK